MSSIEATVSMLEVMPEEARVKVLEFTQELFSAEGSANPFVPKGLDDIMQDIAEAETDLQAGRVYPMSQVLDEIEADYGLV